MQMSVRTLGACAAFLLARSCVQATFFGASGEAASAQGWLLVAGGWLLFPLSYAVAAAVGFFATIPVVNWIGTHWLSKGERVDRDDERR